MLLCLGEPPVRFLWCWLLFFISFLFFILLLYFIHFYSSFCCCSSFIAFQCHPSLVRGLSPGFRTHFILSAQSIGGWFATISFSIFPRSSFTVLPRALRFWVGSFYPQAFFTLRSFTDILPALIKASLGAGSSSLKFAELHTDPWNTDSVHLFVWFTVIHNLHIQKNSFLNSTIYYHELLVLKV